MKIIKRETPLKSQPRTKQLNDINVLGQHHTIICMHSNEIKIAEKNELKRIINNLTRPKPKCQAN